MDIQSRNIWDNKGQYFCTLSNMFLVTCCRVKELDEDLSSIFVKLQLTFLTNVFSCLRNVLLPVAGSA